MPLNLSPEIERQIERVLVLGDKPVMRRPIAAATVLEALPKACERDADLCARVEDYLRRYMAELSIEHLRVSGAATDGESQKPIPNAHGMAVDSAWNVSAKGHYQLNDYILVSAGAIADEDRLTPTNSLLSLGWSFAQLDVGYRDHWLSPLNDSSALIGTEAPTMPSITLSNYEPISRLGLSYEVFAAEMSRQEGISYPGGATAGKPRLASVHLAIEPVRGYALAINKMRQYGGGARGGRGFSDFFDALISTNNKVDVTGDKGANQVASVSSSIIFPGATPVGVRIEYAGEDSAYKPGFRLGAQSLALGLDFPQLWERFDASYEVTEWQNDWYVHSLYPLGLTNKGYAIGHWFGDQRQFGNAVGGMSHSLKLGWHPQPSQYLRLTYRTMDHNSDGIRAQSSPRYERMHAVGLLWATSLFGMPLDIEAEAGRDVFGDEFARIGGSVEFAGYKSRSKLARTTDTAARDAEEQTEWFVDVGGAHQLRKERLVTTVPPRTAHASSTSGHLAVGARRAVSRRMDLGARLELDQMAGNTLLALRALDYRFRVIPRIALSAFIGVGRYDIRLPADGYYAGAGVQYIDLFSGWDVGLDLRHFEKLNRDAEFPGEQPGHPRVYFDIDSVSLYFSRRW